MKLIVLAAGLLLAITSCGKENKKSEPTTRIVPVPLWIETSKRLDTLVFGNEHEGHVPLFSIKHGGDTSWIMVVEQGEDFLGLKALDYTAAFNQYAFKYDKETATITADNFLKRWGSGAPTGEKVTFEVLK
jgi:hypothetical protein